MLADFSGESASWSCHCPTLAHGGKNVLVVMVREPQATGPDPVLLHKNSVKKTADRAVNRRKLVAGFPFSRDVAVTTACRRQAISTSAFVGLVAFKMI